MANDILGISGFGNGTGFVYITAPDGSTIISNVLNDSFARLSILQKALISGPISGESLAVGSTLIQVGAGTITNITINGVGIMGAVAITGATPALMAIDAATKINSATSSPDYTAVADTVNGIVYYYAAPGTGSGPNGYVVVSSVTAPTTTVDTAMKGGSPASGIFDSAFGARYFINSNTAAVEGDLTGANEISSTVIGRTLTGPASQQNGVYLGPDGDAVLGVVRNASIQFIKYINDSSQVIDVITTKGFQDQDVITIIFPNTVGEYTPTTFRDISTATNPSANISLNAGASFATSGVSSNISLRYNSTANRWIELSRNPGVIVSTSNFRSAGLAFPQIGTTITPVVLSGTSIVLTPGTSNEFQQITGTGTLTGDLTVSLSGTPKDGDRFQIDYRATLNLGGFSVIIGGVTLTNRQSLNGQNVIELYYSSSAASWQSIIWQTSPVDLATSAQLFTREPELGTPPQLAYVLTSDLSNNRSWIPNGMNPIIHSEISNSGTPADTSSHILKTYLLPGGTVVNPGDEIHIDAVWLFAANGNTKTATLTYGASTIWSSGAHAFNGEPTVVRSRIVVISGNAEDVSSGTIGTNTIPIIPSLISAAEVISADVTITATGQNGSASANDVICRELVVTIVKKQ